MIAPKITAGGGADAVHCADRGRRACMWPRNLPVDLGRAEIHPARPFFGG